MKKAIAVCALAFCVSSTWADQTQKDAVKFLQATLPDCISAKMLAISEGESDRVMMRLDSTARDGSATYMEKANRHCADLKKNGTDMIKVTFLSKKTKDQNINTRARALLIQWMSALDNIGNDSFDPEEAKFNSLVNDLMLDL